MSGATEHWGFFYQILRTLRVLGSLLKTSPSSPAANAENAHNFASVDHSCVPQCPTLTNAVAQGSIRAARHPYSRRISFPVALISHTLLRKVFNAAENGRRRQECKCVIVATNPTVLRQTRLRYNRLSNLVLALTPRRFHLLKMPCSYEQALTIQDHVADLLTTTVSNNTKCKVVPLFEAVGRKCAQSITSPIASPPFDSAATDGFAINSAATARASPSNPVLFKVSKPRDPGGTRLRLRKATRLCPCVAPSDLEFNTRS